MPGTGWLMPDLRCPGCGASTHVDTLGPNSTSFCPVCDRPLFWGVPEMMVELGPSHFEDSLAAETANGLTGPAMTDPLRDPMRDPMRDTGDLHLRRLPGAGGRERLAVRNCRMCEELNPADGVVCLRCGAELDPPAPPPPPPEPEAVVLADPVEEEEGWGVWILVAVLLGILAAVGVWAYLTM